MSDIDQITERIKAFRDAGGEVVALDRFPDEVRAHFLGPQTGLTLTFGVRISIGYMSFFSSSRGGSM